MLIKIDICVCVCVHITLVSVYLYCVLIGVCYDILCSGFSSRVDPQLSSFLWIEREIWCPNTCHCYHVILWYCPDNQIESPPLYIVAI